MKFKKTLLCLLMLAVTGLSGCGSSSDNEESPPPVTDTNPPAITITGNSTIEVVFNAKFGDLGAEASDDIDGNLPVTVTENIDTTLPGTYELTYSATDSSGNSAQATRTVIVLEDTQASSNITSPQPPFSFLLDGVLIEADYWSEEPKILSAGYGFDGIVGVNAAELTEGVVQEAGGAWATDISCGDDTRNYTSTSTQGQVGNAFIMQTPYGDLKDDAVAIDGLPIVTSWPVDTSTLSLTDFQFTLNTGDIVRPLAVSTFPNVEDNERNVPVVFGEWGNRLPSSDPDARFPIKLEIVEDATPLLLVGPNNQVVSAVGLTWETTTSPYDENNGPVLVGAKLNRIEGPMQGEGLSTPTPVVPANDASVLYDEGDFMLRMLTTGGFSPDGVSGVKPNEFERYFRIHATGQDGETVIIDKVNQNFAVKGGTLRVVGLSDLGQPEGGLVAFDECYDEDLDNYIDIILVGDEEAARSITTLEIPGLEEGYSPFYNPGGPGRTPFEGVTYTQPGPRDLEPVIIALDDPMRVSYNRPEEANNEDLLTFDFDGEQRQYLLTVPAAYTGEVAVPLLFEFHQAGGTAQQQFDDSQLSVIAERENFILVTPQGIDNLWSVTGFPPGGNANDLGFIEALIADLSKTYNINANRIYATGMSNGSLLAFDLACNLSNTFAAVAPVSGVLTGQLLTSCSPQRPVPVLQTHGTADPLIPYEQAETTVSWWVTFNQTQAVPQIIDLDDPFPANGTSVQRFVYANGTSGVSVEHLKIENGAHVWPGSDGASDINMAEEIWQFFSRFDLNGVIAD